MSEQASSNSTLYFVVGGLLVAVLVIGYFTMGGGGGESGIAPAASAIVEDAGTDFKLELGKDGGVSGSIDQKE